MSERKQQLLALVNRAMELNRQRKRSFPLSVKTIWVAQAHFGGSRWVAAWHVVTFAWRYAWLLVRSKL
jgi:hypothetical protein